MKKHILAIITIGIIVSGCTSARISSQLASGQIPCRPEEIVITEETAAAFTGMHNWVAECNGKKYVCNYHQTSGVRCTEMGK